VQDGDTTGQVAKTAQICIRHPVIRLDGECPCVTSAQKSCRLLLG
jgi:hypothetical protein